MLNVCNEIINQKSDFVLFDKPAPDFDDVKVEAYMIVLRCC